MRKDEEKKRMDSAEALTLPKVLVSPAGIPWIYDLSPDMSKTPTKSTGIGRMDIIWTSYGHKMDHELSSRILPRAFSTFRR